MKTAFASAERSNDHEIIEASQKLQQLQERFFFINAVPNIMLVLNKNRQIVLANNALLSYLNISNFDGILGLRPGELLECKHADKSEGGCGTTINCMVCGAVRAILSSQEGNISTEECRVMTNNNDALDYKVHTVPLDIDNERFVVFTITDVSNEKRREALERIFFHDVLNTAGGIQGFAELLELSDPDEVLEFGKILSNLTGHLIDEIQAQRDLLLAEKNELQLKLEMVNGNKIIDEIVQLYFKHPVAQNKQLINASDSRNITLYNDPRLLRRVLGNLVKNALEASTEGEVVTVKVEKRFKYTVFSVHNQRVIPALIKLQIFNRSFSTKGLGRGLGTYSVKLLTEKYLKGRVGFFTDETHGTSFYIILE